MVHCSTCVSARVPPFFILKVSVTTRGEHVVCCLGELHLEQSLKVGGLFFVCRLVSARAEKYDVGLRSDSLSEGYKSRLRLALYVCRYSWW